MSFFRMICFYFFIYSFLGWIVESLFNLATKGSFMKLNFLRFPIKPMYGIASIVLVLLQSLVPLWLFIPCCFVVPSLIEYLTAALLFHTFSIKYWDYTHIPYNLSGYICLRFSIYWLCLSLFLVYGLHPMIIWFYEQVSWFWLYFFPILLLAFIIDVYGSISSKLHRSVKTK